MIATLEYQQLLDIVNRLILDTLYDLGVHCRMGSSDSIWEWNLGTGPQHKELCVLAKGLDIP